jgi:hypothetical protein
MYIFRLILRLRSSFFPQHLYRLVFVMGMQCVLYAPITEPVNIVYVRFMPHVVTSVSDGCVTNHKFASVIYKIEVLHHFPIVPVCHMQLIFCC